MATYPKTTTIEVHRDGRWLPAATLQALGHDRCRVDYLPEYVFGSPEPWPIAFGIPLGHVPDVFVDGPTGREADRRPPSFIYDLVPQGRGRKYMVEKLKLVDHDSLIMPLVMAGAFNPIGNLRISSAVDFFQREAMANPDPVTSRGFTLPDVMEKSEGFLEHLSLHAMLASGTTGVQGVAPKYLLTTDLDDQWFADLAVPDDRAGGHWLLKLPRGKSEVDQVVLRNEAAYLRLAAACGLREISEVYQQKDVLFLRRFDREVVDGRTHRLQQESLASVCGLRGFGTISTQQNLLAGLRSVVTDPLQETIEFMKRDVLNQAMRNTDNHARNTAVQRLQDGTVQLTPFFDFGPMFMDEEVITRGSHWRDAAGRRQETWAEVIETLDVDDEERTEIASHLYWFSREVGMLQDKAETQGVDRHVIAQCLQSIERQAEQLQALRPMVHSDMLMPGPGSHG